MSTETNVPEMVPSRAGNQVAPGWYSWAILGALLATIVFAILTWRARSLGHGVLNYGVPAYVLGALVLSVLWNLQLNSAIKSRSRGLADTRALGIFGDATRFAKICALLGLVAAIIAVIPVALQLAVMIGRSG